jgi:hypothetical protein
MKASNSIIALTLTAAASMTGCTTYAQWLAIELPRATAIAIGGNAVAPEQVKISDDPGVVDRSGALHWHASAPNGEFDCSGIPIQTLGVVSETVCVKK